MTVQLLIALAWLASDLHVGAATGEVINSPGLAQARLAEALADADAVDDVRVHGDTVSFVIDHAGERFSVDATIETDGAVAAVSIHDAGRREAVVARGRYDWLAREATEIQSVHALVIDTEGTVTLATGDGRHYLVIPDRHDGNSGVEARWAAAWNNT
jgi:hypothetical protein